MEPIKLWGRNGEAVRRGIEAGKILHLDTASEEITDEFLLFAINSGLLRQWSDGFPDPRRWPQIKMEVLLAAHLAGRFAGIYSLRKTGFVLRSAWVLGALGYSVQVLEPERGVSARGTRDDKLMSGDVLRKLLVKLEQVVKPKADESLPQATTIKVRARLSRRAVKKVDDQEQIERRGRAVAERLIDWYNHCVSPAMLAYAQVGTGRRLQILDTTPVEVALTTGTYECSGVVRDEDGTLHRGYKVATLRTLLDLAGIITGVRIGPIQQHDLPLSLPLLRDQSLLRAGDLLMMDRGFLDGETITYLKKERAVDVVIPLRADMLSYQEAVALAQAAKVWKAHPSREEQEIAFVEGVEHIYDQCQVKLNACVIRFYNERKRATDYIVLVTTDERMPGEWIVRHYEQRPEIEQDYQQMKSGGWLLQKLTSTRYSETVFYLLTVLLSYSLYHLFANTHAGARFAEKTRAAIALEQLRSHRTHVIAYAGGYFEIFETFDFVRLVLQLSQTARERLSDWLEQHLDRVGKT